MELIMETKALSRKQKLYRFFSWTLVILWMTLIFYFSAQPAGESTELSSGVSVFILNIFMKITSNINIDINIFHFIIRKTAHFFLYFMLGILLLNALKKGRTIEYKTVIIAIIVCVVYAASDEMHQLFVPGRSGQLRDVIIDSLGSCAGIGIFSLISRIYIKFKKT